MAMALLDGMKEFFVPIDHAGRIVLPKGIRDELAIKPGDTFKVSIQGTAVTFTPNTESAGFVRKGKALVFSTPGDKTLSNETVTQALETGRLEREASGAAGLRRRKHAS
jgi:AbrB family looped-hinge helix DNA binding protein